MNYKKNIVDRKSTIGIIGLGYVGLPLLIRFVSENFKTIGFDVDKSKITSLNNGKTYIKHISNRDIQSALDNGFRATNNFKDISLVDVMLICVPTPLGIHNEPDISYIKHTLKSIKPYLKEGQLLILESTTYPGTTEEELVPFVENCGFKVGVNYFIGYSPEREDPGNKDYNTKSIPKVVSGYTKECLENTKTLYDQILDQTVPVSSTKTAEMTKILENIHRAVNIGLVNELKVVSDKMNIDIYEVIDAASTKPFGFTPYYPGPGLGGHCIPIDPFYLSWKAKEVGMHTRFIELAGEINASMPNYVIDKISLALNRISKSINGSKILVLGLSYKKNIDDLRESPSLEIIDLLLDLGAKIHFSDPFFKKIPMTRKYDIDITSEPLDKDTISSADLILLATDHDDYDYNLIYKEAKLIVDTRGRFREVNEKVIKA